MGFASDYVTAIMHRGRVPMEPVDFVPNWADRPRKWKHYPGAERLPLPDDEAAEVPTVQDGLFGGRRDGRFTLPLLGGMLLDSYGLVGRRLGIQANTDVAALPHYTHANWYRGAASGGGLYPVSIYLVAGASGPLTPGVYHYSVPHHALQLLMAGDVSAEMHAAIADPGIAGQADHFLLVGVKYWQNAFKYNSFSFHAVSMDVGAAIQTWRMWARAHGIDVTPAFWFDEPRVARLLGVSGEDEGAFAVVPLPWGQPAENAKGPEALRETGGAPLATVRRRDSERSRRLIRFDAVERMHATTVVGASSRPAIGDLRVAVAPPIRPGLHRHALPGPAALDVGIREALRRRRSSFGRFEATSALGATQLATALAASAEGALDSDAGVAGVPLAKLYVLVNHVDGVPPGSYEYDPATNSLQLIRAEPPGEFLQRNYFLANYNLEQAAAVIVPTVRSIAVLDAVGDRGYRLINATIGAIAQALYTAAAALDLGCGVALGFDNISFIEQLDLEKTGESPLLIMMIGHERQRPADFRYEIA